MKKLFILCSLFLAVSTAYSLPNFWYSAVAYNSTGQIITTSPLASVQVTVKDGINSMTQTIPNVPVDAFGIFNIYVNGAGLASVNLVARTQIIIKVNGIIVTGSPLTSTLTLYDYLGYLKSPTGTVKVGSALDPQNFVVVDGTTNFGGNVTMGNQLHVVGAVDFDDALNVDGPATFNHSITQTNAGQLITFAGNLNANLGLDVTNGNFTVGTLPNQYVIDWTNGYQQFINGPVTVNDQLNVMFDADVDGNLNVDGTTATFGPNPFRIADDLLVTGTTALNSTLSVTGMSTLNGGADINGQTTINATVGGGQGNYSAYPFRVQGSDQGIAIKVNGSRSNANNFVSFWDNAGMQGRIEGETTTELLTNPEYIFDNSMFAVDIAIASAELGIAIAEEVQAVADQVAAATSVNVCVGVGAVACPPIASLIVAAATNLVLKSANLAVVGVNEAKVIAEPIAYNTFKLSQIGVTYSSGAGDYAEWLPKANTVDDFRAGEIVGIKGGKISASTENAERIMVVSRKPIVLGNMPEAGKESEYEKIAFMGQVPVKVQGIVKEGDYILPSGYNDGFGIAVNPENMKIEDYQKIVGIAWTGSSSSVGNYVNVAVGLNNNDVAKYAMKMEKKIDEQSRVIDEMKARLDKMESVLAKLDPEFASTIQNNTAKKVISSNTNTANIPENQPSVTYYRTTKQQMEESIAFAESKLREAGVDVDKHPFFMKIKSDPEYKKYYINKMIRAVDKEFEKQAKINSEEGIRTYFE